MPAARPGSRPAGSRPAGSRPCSRPVGSRPAGSRPCSRPETGDSRRVMPRGARFAGARPGVRANGAVGGDLLLFKSARNSSGGKGTAPRTALPCPPPSFRMGGGLGAGLSVAGGTLPGMPNLAEYDAKLLAATLRNQNQLIRRDQAFACALTPGALRHRLRPGGPWRAVLPGIYFAGGGALTIKQRNAAAFLLAGDQALAITGSAAVAWHGIPCPASEVVDVLVPLTCRRASVGFARLHRTGRRTETGFRDGVVRYAIPARAIGDAVRQLASDSDVRALVAASVQRGKVAIWQLEEELAAGTAPGSARLRSALAEVADGVRSVAEGDLRTLIKKTRLPDPLYNPRLYVGSQFLACPDAWWPEAGVAVEVESKAYHLSPASWEATLGRQARMVAEGILVVAVTPQRVRSEGWKVAREIRSALERSGGALGHINTVPADRQLTG